MRINNLNLNFLPEYHMFYDWLITDNINNNASVLIHKVDSNTIIDLIKYKIKLLDQTILLEGSVHLFTDEFSSIVITFDKNGNSLSKSSLLLKDELKIIDKLSLIETEKLRYKKISKDIVTNNLRFDLEIRNVIKHEIQKLRQNNHYDKLAYLYYEWFKTIDTDYEKMLNLMIKKLLLPLTEKELYIYNLIKKDYKLV